MFSFSQSFSQGFLQKNILQYENISYNVLHNLSCGMFLQQPNYSKRSNVMYFFDRMTPIIENPFRYFHNYISCIGNKDEFWCTEFQENFLVIVMYREIHKITISELCIHHLKQSNANNMIKHLKNCDISNVAWLISSVDETVLVNFGFELIDYIKLQHNLYTKNKFLFNPFKYLDFELNSRMSYLDRIHSGINKNTIIFKGTQLPLATVCGTIKRTFDLSKYNNTLTLATFLQFLHEMHNDILSDEEYNHMMQIRDLSSVRTTFVKKYTAYSDFITYNLKIIDIHYTNCVFQCVADKKIK